MYATVEDVANGFRVLTEDEEDVCEALLDEASEIVDAYNKDATAKRKKIVCCHMVRRAIGNNDIDVPMGATTGSMSALGYSQSWTMAGGSTGELYMSKTDKKLLGVSSRVGCSSILEDK